MVQCFIGLGSNLEQPLRQVTEAVAELAQLARCQLGKVSPWYTSKAIGPGQQPDYINGAVELYTELSAPELLAALHGIENRHQHKRTQRWGARTLDLDLLLYGQQCINSATLTVPHPRMLQRNFVIYPLYTIAPTLILPNGTPLAQWFNNTEATDLQVLSITVQYNNKTGD